MGREHLAGGAEDGGQTARLLGRFNLQTGTCCGGGVMRGKQEAARTVCGTIRWERLPPPRRHVPPCTMRPPSFQRPPPPSIPSDDG